MDNRLGLSPSHATPVDTLATTGTRGARDNGQIGVYDV